jgi:Holliday junction DNA helicase RuvA
VIASVRGNVLRAGLDSVVVDVGGVGMLVHTTPRTAAGMRTGQSASLATSMVVREESLTLYGFADEDERSLFETVQTVSGVGPRLALAMLAVHSPDAVRAAVTTGDLVALTKVPGIGRKGAERIVLELRDKIGVPSEPVSVGDRPATAAWQGQVREALVGLGWTVRQADDAVEAVTPMESDGATVSALLKAALQELGR